MTLRQTFVRSAIYLILIVAAAYFLLPVYVLVITSLKPFSQVDVSHMLQLPKTISFRGFTTAWDSIAPNFRNSLLITLPAALISSLVGALNGYVFAKWSFRGSNVVFLLFLFGMFLPYQGLLIPLVVTLQHLGLYGTITGVIVIHCILGIPITALMFRAYFARIPNQLLEAAKLDGCGFFRIFRWIMLPVAPPAFAVVLLWQFTTIWNDYIISVVVLNNPTVAPVTVALQNLAASDYVQWNVQMAGALIAALPTLLVYLALGKLFMKGLLSGALKG